MAFTCENRWSKLFMWAHGQLCVACSERDSIYASILLPHTLISRMSRPLLASRRSIPKYLTNRLLLLDHCVSLLHRCDPILGIRTAPPTLRSLATLHRDLRECIRGKLRTWPALSWRAYALIDIQPRRWLRDNCRYGSCFARLRRRTRRSRRRYTARCLMLARRHWRGTMIRREGKMLLRTVLVLALVQLLFGWSGYVVNAPSVSLRSSSQGIIVASKLLVI